MFCLYNVKTNETLTRMRQRFTTTLKENEDGIKPFFFVIDGTERIEFHTLDDASKYAARFDLYATGWVPQPITANNRVVWSYDDVECRNCGRRYKAARDIGKCRCKSRERRRLESAG